MDKIEGGVQEILPDDQTTGELSQGCCGNQLEEPCNYSEETLAVHMFN